ncbi:hypothetical protein A2U01_0025849 [Trifolium medium]|uniref:Uncharacterized protein n=1 Tax=Trifolium medium TaxID=97028 RepID=A0A392NYD0_9FABA|nr:hypothetical protein [Trifolium medium]
MGLWEILSDVRFNGKREISFRIVLMLPPKPERLREMRLVNLWKRRVELELYKVRENRKRSVIERNRLETMEMESK